MKTQMREEKTGLSTLHGTPTGPERWRKTVWIVLGLIAIAVAVYLIWFRSGAKEETASTSPASDAGGKVTFLMEQQWRIKMKLALVEERMVARQITATGQIIPAADKHAALAPAVSGLIAGGGLPRIGQRVKAGQTIAVLRQIVTVTDQSQIRAAQAQDTQAALDAARLIAERRTVDGEIETTRVRLEQARRDAARARILNEQGILPKQEAERSESNSRAAQAEHDAALKRRKALDEVRTVDSPKGVDNGSSAVQTIRAPITGVVTKVNKNLGEQVAAGEVILEITNLDTIWVEAPIFERDLGLIGKNTKASFTIGASPGQEIQGSVIAIGNVLDKNTRAAKVVFSVSNPGEVLRIGMQANVRLDTEETVLAMAIPRESVVEDEGKKIVYVLVSGEEFERREVTIGPEIGEKVLVTKGLKSGERVVTQGALQLKLHELNPGERPAHTHET